jgi:hypothetical protein
VTCEAREFAWQGATELGGVSCRFPGAPERGAGVVSSLGSTSCWRRRPRAGASTLGEPADMRRVQTVSVEAERHDGCWPGRTVRRSRAAPCPIRAVIDSGGIGCFPLRLCLCGAAPPRWRLRRGPSGQRNSEHVGRRARVGGIVVDATSWARGPWSDLRAEVWSTGSCGSSVGCVDRVW